MATVRADGRDAKNGTEETKVANDGAEPLAAGADGGCGTGLNGMGWFIANASEHTDVARVLFELTGDVDVKVM